MPEYLRIATRRSPLALWQADHVRAQLLSLHPGLEVELVAITTRGDKILDSPLAKVGGKGLFVKELETSLGEGRTDIAVHSMKDVPVVLPEGFDLPAILLREDPRDVLVSNRWGSLEALPPGARVGTSSLRRHCQLKALRPDLEVVDLRGNVGTRLKRLDEGELDAIVLAAAGVKRLGFTGRVRQYFDPQLMLPAIGQGAIGIECRAGDRRVLELIAPLDDRPTRLRVDAERSVNRRLHGGCQVPIAGHAVLEGDRITLTALVGRVDGSRIVRGEVSGAAADGEILGVGLAEDLLARGAREILEELARLAT